MSDIVVCIVALVLLFFSGAFSGLNIGMMMARPDDLRRKAARGDKVAARVYKYRKDGYYLIFCILLGNVGINTAMSILLGSITSGLIGGLIATALITTFGEILPQAIFTQRGYRAARYLFWLLDIIYVVFWPLALPASKLLNRWIGKEPPSIYTHDELEQIIHEHADSQHSLLDKTESRIVSGALNFSRQQVFEVMTPLERVVSIRLDDQLTPTVVRRLLQSGHSRIPVTNDAGKFVGVLYMKDLVDADFPVLAARVYRDKIHTINHHSRLDTALNRFTQTRSHIACVVGEGRQVLGILTLEDVIESILQRPIVDEHDGEQSVA